MIKAKDQKRRIEFEAIYKKVMVTKKNKTKTSEYYYEVNLAGERTLIECRPGREITFVEKLEKVFVEKE